MLLKKAIERAGVLFEFGQSALWPIQLFFQGFSEVPTLKNIFAHLLVSAVENNLLIKLFTLFQ